MRRAGVGQGSRVVCYDASDATAAARAWWLLRFHGHPPDRVAVLDGGFAAWVEAGNPVDGGGVEASPGDFVAAPGHLPSRRRRCRRLDRPGGCPARRPHRDPLPRRAGAGGPCRRSRPRGVVRPDDRQRRRRRPLPVGRRAAEAVRGNRHRKRPGGVVLRQRRARDPPGARARARRRSRRRCTPTHRAAGSPTPAGPWRPAPSPAEPPGAADYGEWWIGHSSVRPTLTRHPTIDGSAASS